jgi:hypothetical protein
MKNNFFTNIILTTFLVSTTIYGASTNMPTILQAQNYDTKLNLFLKIVEKAQKFYSARDVLKIAIDNVTIDGLYLELGVFKGDSINYIANLKPNIIVHGFDSFEGLPEQWQRDDTTYFTQGFFALSSLPIVAQNVILHQGWFDSTLPIFKQDVLKNQPIAFLHIDCDLYSSTKTAFECLGDNIVVGTIITFDELYGYPGFDRHELKALYEFLSQNNLDVEFLAYNQNHEQVCVRVIDPIQNT